MGVTFDCWEGGAIQAWAERFRDAVLRVEKASDAIGIRGIVVQMILEAARALYLALGFEALVADGASLIRPTGYLFKLRAVPGSRGCRHAPA